MSGCCQVPSNSPGVVHTTGPKFPDHCGVHEAIIGIIAEAQLQQQGPHLLRVRATPCAKGDRCQDMCLVLVGMCYHHRMLICRVLMHGSGSYLTVTEGTMAGQFLNESLV